MKATSPSKEATVKTQRKDNQLEFEQVEVRRLDPKREGNEVVVRFERLKVKRPRVLLTREQADVLNIGVKTCDDNRIFFMYLLPEEEISPIIKSGQVHPLGGKDRYLV